MAADAPAYQEALHTVPVLGRRERSGIGVIALACFYCSLSHPVQIFQLTYT